jgi:hypothetical protein
MDGPTCNSLRVITQALQSVIAPVPSILTSSVGRRSQLEPLSIYEGDALFFEFFNHMSLFQSIGLHIEDIDRLVLDYGLPRASIYDHVLESLWTTIKHLNRCSRPLGRPSTVVGPWISSLSTSKDQGWRVTLDFTQVMAAFEGALWELEESEFEAGFDGEPSKSLSSIKTSS